MSEILNFTSTGAKLQGRLFSPIAHAPSGKAIVVILTGDSPNGTKSKTWPAMIDTLTDNGISVFAFDFLSQGYSKGDRADLTLSVGCQNFLDAYCALAERIDLHHHRIGLLGSSFGAAVVLGAHTRIDPPHAIALKSPASFLPESYETEHGFPEGMELWRQDGISSITGLHYSAYLEAIEQDLYCSAMTIQAPVLIVHGTDDTIVPIVQSRRLYHLLNGKATLLELPGVNHDYKQPGAGREALQDAIRHFFIEQLLLSAPLS